MEDEKEILVEVKGVSKKFSRNLKKSMLYGLKDMGRSVLGLRRGGTTLRPDEFWAVKNVSFTVRRGECVGLIGRNGAGKSTLLKMLNGLILPDEGTITMHGKVGAMIELGAGFNPLLTGRENVFVNGQLLGFSKKEVEERLPAILEFAELGEFIDSPVQNYSSGMKVRLGFAVAAQMEPDVLIIDEVLAVGDLGFVLKCFNTIDHIIKKTAVIFVSHNMPQVSRICSTILLMDKGGPSYLGNDVSEGINRYYAGFGASTGSNVVFSRDGDAGLLEIALETQAQTPAGTLPQIRWQDDLIIHMKLKVRTTIPHPSLAMTFHDKEQRPFGVCVDEKGLEQKHIFKTADGFNYFQVRLVVPKINLSKGLYSLSLSVGEAFRSKPVLRVQHACEFQVTAQHEMWEPILFAGEWQS